MLHTTFELAHKSGACVTSYKKMADALGGITKYGKATPIPMDKVVEILGTQDAIWALRCTNEPAEKFITEFACRCAEYCLKNYEDLYPDDKRPRQAIEAARAYSKNEITLEQLKMARSAARSAAESAESAPWSARSAAESAAWLAESAAESAAWSAESAGSAESAALEWQKQTFLEMLNQQ